MNISAAGAVIVWETDKYRIANSERYISIKFLRGQSKSKLID